MKIILPILFICLFSSCSSTDFSKLFSDETKEVEDRNNKLMEDFEVDEKVLKKFTQRIEEKKAPPKVEVKKKPENKKTKEQSKKSKKKNKKPQIIPKKAKVSLKRAVVKPKIKKITKIELNRIQKIQKKDDYPSKLKELDSVSKKFWSEFKPTLSIGEKVVFSIKYGMINTGTIAIETRPMAKVGNIDTYHLRVRVKTSSYYSYLYELDDICDSYVKKSDFMPLKFSLIQRQSSQNVDDLQLFDNDELKSYSFYKRVTDEKTQKEKKENYTPQYFQDPLSIVYFLRGLPFTIGRSYTIPFINKGKVEKLTARIDRREVIETEVGKKKAFRVVIKNEHKGKTIKGGEMVFWFADDENKMIIQFEADSKIGSISGKLIEYSK